MTFKLDNFLEMRRNYDAYSTFYSVFLPSIVGKRRFNRLLRTLKDEEEIATVSDEALALLAIENSWKRWDKIFDNSNGEIRRYTKNETKPEGLFDNLPPPEYTKTAKDDPESEKNTEDKNWNEAGISRFNELRQLVINDRASYPDFTKKWIKSARQTQLKRKTREEDSDDCPDADDDLFSDLKTSAKSKKAKITAGVESEVEVSEDGSRTEEEE